MSVKSIKLNQDISDPEVVAISLQARKGERTHLLGLLRIRLTLLKKEDATPAEIYSALDGWIDERSKIIGEQTK